MSCNGEHVSTDICQLSQFVNFLNYEEVPQCRKVPNIGIYDRKFHTITKCFKICVSSQSKKKISKRLVVFK